MLYQGNVFKKFLVDRMAMGFDRSTIRSEFCAKMGVPITDDEISEILKDSDIEIRQREDELLTELRSQNVVSALLAIKEELSEVAKLAKEDKDYRTFAQISNTSIKSIEVLISMTKNFADREETRNQISIQNNVLVLQLLEKDGVLKILDQSKLQSILGTAATNSGIPSIISQTGDD
jgi:hypothetical protein